MTAGDWRSEAACVGKPIEWFFPERDGGGDYRQARELCAGCPVLASCLEHAKRMPEGFGMWAGLTAQDRGSYKRQAWT